MKNLKLNQQKHVKTLPKAKSAIIVLITMMMTILCTNKVNAQQPTWSNLGNGEYLDRWTINDDNSNHWSHLRLQVGNEHSWNMVNQGSLLWWGYGQNGNHGDAGVIKMGLTSDAKFGLGIIPTQALHIKGQTNNDNPIIFLDPKTWTSAGHYGELRFGDTNHYIRGEHSVGMTFYDSNCFIFNNGASNQMIFGNDGKLSIGTTNMPTTLGGADVSAYKLFVKGGVLTEEVRVRTGWADYVFDADYKLLTIQEVESFIKENGHLPNVPSEKLVEAQGIELGDITRIQQEKIEELVLYIIEQQKQIDALKQSVDTLMKKK